MVDLGYSIHFGNLAQNLSGFLKLNSFSKIAVLVDENTKQDCYAILENELSEFYLIEIKSGETNKNLSTCEFVLSQLSDKGFDRKSLALCIPIIFKVPLPN